MSLSVHYQNVKFRLKQSNKVKEWIHYVLSEENKRCGDIDIYFVGADSLLEINREFLEHDYDTDVITFDYSMENLISGEIYIGQETVKNNARTYGTTLRREILRVVLHGVLHLAGYNDKEEEEILIMREREEYYLLKWSNGEF